ncbi:MAG: carotenoid biosynthesis protein [Pyrinomonadaceae bacterium]
MKRQPGAAQEKSLLAKIRRVVLLSAAAVYAVFWIGGLGRHLFATANQDWTGSVFLFLAGMIVMLGSPSPGYLGSLVAAGVLGFGIEAIGVRYGLPFGAYSYTHVLQPQWLGVPLVMAAAWLVLIAYVRQMLLHFHLPAWLGALLGAAWMTGIDLVIDPLAANQLGYWHWQLSGIYYGVPAINFAGWFVASALVLFVVGPARAANKPAPIIGLSIILFFTGTAFFLHAYLVGLVGLALFAIHILAAGPLRYLSSAGVNLT